MSRSRHKMKAKGGEVFYAGGESNVRKEADMKAHGGGVHEKVKKHSMKHMRAEGGKPKHRLDKFKRGGRAKGGRTGADQHPLSSAANIKHQPGEVRD